MREGGILKAGRAQSELAGFVQKPQLKTDTICSTHSPLFIVEVPLKKPLEQWHKYFK